MSLLSLLDSYERFRDCSPSLTRGIPCCLQDVSFLLFLNKYDLFEKKVQRVSPSRFSPCNSIVRTFGKPFLITS
jgi:hypothetical protein